MPRNSKRIADAARELLPTIGRRAVTAAIAGLAPLALAACSSSLSPSADQDGLRTIPTIGRRLQAVGESNNHVWLPTGPEIAYATSFPYPYNGPPAHIRAVDARTGAVRIILPPQQAGSVYRFQLVPPYVYYWIESTLYRSRLDGAGAPQSLTSLNGEPPAWAVSADNRWVTWWAGGNTLPILDLASGARRTVAVPSLGGHLLFLSPDGSSLIAIPDSRETATDAQWIDLGSGTTRKVQLPCWRRDGSLVNWNGTTPTLYAACAGAFYRIVAGGEASVVLSLNGEDGAWSPTLDRVSVWRRSCPSGWTASLPVPLSGGRVCRGARWELLVQHLNQAEPKKVGTIEFDAREDDATTTAVFSTDGRHLFFSLHVSRTQIDGLYAAAVE